MSPPAPPSAPNTPAGQRYELVLEAVPGRWQSPPLCRFKALLKAALRAYGLRCVSSRELDGKEKTPGPTGP